MYAIVILFGTLAVVAIVATVRDIRSDGYRRRPSREADWDSQFEGIERR